MSIDRLLIALVLFAVILIAAIAVDMASAKPREQSTVTLITTVEYCKVYHISNPQTNPLYVSVSPQGYSCGVSR